MIIYIYRTSQLAASVSHQSGMHFFRKTFTFYVFNMKCVKTYFAKHKKHIKKTYFAEKFFNMFCKTLNVEHVLHNILCFKVVNFEFLKLKLIMLILILSVVYMSDIINLIYILLLF